MINFSNSCEHFQGNIYDYISQEEIYYKCLGYYPNTKHDFNSPFSRDSTPSMRFKQEQNLFWKCFSTNRGGDAIALVAQLNNISYKEAVLHIYNNFPIQKRERVAISDYSIEKKRAKIEVIIPDKIPASFYDYWDKFDVSKRTLDLYNIKPVKEVWLNDKLRAVYKDSSPVIRYLINTRYKIYQPYNKEFKWLSNTKVDDIQGFMELPEKGDLLVISKAMKDVLVWHELGYHAIALCSETTNLLPEAYNHFKGRFSNIISFLDNDRAGITTMKNYNEQYGIPFSMMPVETECKDIAEFVHLYGLEEAAKLIKNLKF